MIDPEKHETWKTWLKDIELDVRNLDRTHFLWGRLSDHFWHKEHPHWGYWAKYFLDTYTVYAVSTIRRQIRHNRQSVSLHGLLLELKASSPDISGDWWLTFSTRDRSYWNGRFGTSCGNLNPEKVDAEVAKLSHFDNLLEIADRRLAHWDRRGIDAEAETQDITKALIAMEEALDFTHEIILGDHRPLTNDYEDIPVEEVFSVPWLKEEEGDK